MEADISIWRKTGHFYFALTPGWRVGQSHRRRGMLNDVPRIGYSRAVPLPEWAGGRRREEVLCATTAPEEYRGRRGSHIIISLPDNEGRRSAGVRGAKGSADDFGRQ